MKNTASIYKNLFDMYGAHDERSLGWSKNKQQYRFERLLRFLRPCPGETLLDVGCGFGDLFVYMENVGKMIRYYGIDVVEDFINVASHDFATSNAEFMCGDFGTNDNIFDNEFSYVVASGIFGFKIYGTDEEEYAYVDKIFSKAHKLASVGVAFDFLSDKVDYRANDNNFFASPEKILGIAYRYSRNVILDNSMMPFEFAVTIFKNDKFNPMNTMFDTYFKGR